MHRQQQRQQQQFYHTTTRVNVFKVNRNCFLYAKIDAKISEHDSSRKREKKSIRSHTQIREWLTKEKNEHCEHERHIHAEKGAND